MIANWSKQLVFFSLLSTFLMFLFLTLSIFFAWLHRNSKYAFSSARSFLQFTLKLKLAGKIESMRIYLAKYLSLAQGV